MAASSRHIESHIVNQNKKKRNEIFLMGQSPYNRHGAQDNLKNNHVYMTMDTHQALRHKTTWHTYKQESIFIT